MKRDIDLKEISDGKLYTSNDLVKVGCNDCAGCSACCRGMESTIILDPYDMWQLAAGCGSGLEQLMAENRVELGVVDGVILPHLKLAAEGESCTFLNAEGRCSIHAYRPGICRLFPLGRVYEGDSFRYFLQIHECQKENRTKLKVRQWLGIPELKKYEAFVVEWHSYLKAVQEAAEAAGDDDSRKALTMKVLKFFYLIPWNGQADFYEQFARRVRMARFV